MSHVFAQSWMSVAAFSEILSISLANGVPFVFSSLTSFNLIIIKIRTALEAVEDETYVKRTSIIFLISRCKARIFWLFSCCFLARVQTICIVAMRFIRSEWFFVPYLEDAHGNCSPSDQHWSWNDKDPHARAMKGCILATSVRTCMRTSLPSIIWLIASMLLVVSTADLTAIRLFSLPVLGETIVSRGSWVIIFNVGRFSYELWYIPSLSTAVSSFDSLGSLTFELSSLLFTESLRQSTRVCVHRYELRTVWFIRRVMRGWHYRSGK